MSATQNPPAFEENPPGLFERLGIGALSVIAANAGLVFLYLRFDLTLTQLLIVYWLESLWIGVFCALKLITASMIGDPYDNKWVRFSGGAGVLTSLFAIMLLGGKFILLFVLLGLGIAFGSAELSGQKVELILFEELGLLLGISGIFIAGHGISFVANFLILGEYRSARVGALLALPFKRCIALMGAMVIAFTTAFSIPGFGNSTAFGVILILVKLVWDYRLHVRERSDMAVQNA